MSADVAGSTAYKAESDALRAAEPGWLKVFSNFYANFPIMLMGLTAVEMMDEESLPEISVWKALGDELIMTAKIESAEEAMGLVRAFYLTMAQYEDRHLNALPLRLKATCWVAEFPSPNIEIEIPELSGRLEPLIDYIGPSIDLGFRIGKFSRPSTVVLSLDLVEILLASRRADELTYFVLGREPLKGVMFGRAYPIIWARPSERPFNFMPWELEDCALTRKAAAEPPSGPQALTTLIDDVRLYLQKMRGITTKPMSSLLTS
jgi:hypothetical protein